MVVENLFKQQMQSFVPDFEIKTKRVISILNFLQTFHSGILKVTLKSGSEAFFFFMEGALLFRGQRKGKRVVDFIFILNDTIQIIPSSFDSVNAKFEYSNSSVFNVFPQWVNYFANMKGHTRFKLINISVDHVRKEFGL